MRKKIFSWLSGSGLPYALLTALALALAAVIIATSAALAEPGAPLFSTGGAPSMVSYQGRVQIGGVPYNGAGYFKFALVDSAGTTSYWSNDGSSSAGDEPGSAVALTVGNGLFSVLLGDTSLGNMTQPLTAAALRGSDRALRVWFSSDNLTFTQLSPDTRLASVPYALQAQEAHNADYSYYPLLQAQSLDLAEVGSALKGFKGGFTDGRYGYFVPYENDSGFFGRVARVDLNNFTTGGVSVLDLTMVDIGLRGFWGGFTDGRYGYFVPHQNFSGYHGKVARVDLQNFTTGGVIPNGGVSMLNLETVDSGLKGFRGGFTDGRYGYFVPSYNGSYHGKVARVDLQNFTTGGVSVLDLTMVDGDLKGFQNGFTDGRYGYFVPFNIGSDNSGKVARIDLKNFTIGGVSVLNLATVDSDLKGFAGGFTDGRYGYFARVNTFSGKIARVDLQNFTTGGVSVLDLATVDSNLKGFQGGFTDGRYGYFINSSYYDGKLARIDLQNFTSSGVSWQYLEALDSGLIGFSGGFTDGRYGYFVPYATGPSIFHGKVARIQLFSGTTGP